MNLYLLLYCKSCFACIAKELKTIDQVHDYMLQDKKIIRFFKYYIEEEYMLFCSTHPLWNYIISNDNLFKDATQEKQYLDFVQCQKRIGLFKGSNFGIPSHVQLPHIKYDNLKTKDNLFAVVSKDKCFIVKYKERAI